MRALITRTRARRQLGRPAAHQCRGAACSPSRRGSPSASQRSRCCSSAGISMRRHAERVEAERARRRGQLALERVEIDRAGPRSWHHRAQYNEPMALPTALYSAAQVRALDAYAIEPARHPRLHADEAGRRGGAALPAHALADGASHRHRLRQRQQRRRRLRAGALRAGRGSHRLGAGRQRTRTARGRCAPGLRRTTARAAAQVPRLRRDAARGRRGHRRCAARYRAVRARCAPELLEAHPRHQRQRQAGVRARCALGARRATPAWRCGEAVRADGTVTFVGLKTGLFVGDGPEFAGTVFFDDLELAPAADGAVRAAPERIVEAEIQRGAAAPARARPTRATSGAC